jgi:hypothetical protein
LLVKKLRGSTGHRGVRLASRRSPGSQPRSSSQIAFLLREAVLASISRWGGPRYAIGGEWGSILFQDVTVVRMYVLEELFLICKMTIIRINIPSVVRPQQIRQSSIGVFHQRTGRDSKNFVRCVRCALDLKYISITLPEPFLKTSLRRTP